MESKGFSVSYDGKTLNVDLKPSDDWLDTSLDICASDNRTTDTVCLKLNRDDVKTLIGFLLETLIDRLEQGWFKRLLLRIAKIFV